MKIINYTMKKHLMTRIFFL